MGFGIIMSRAPTRRMGAALLAVSLASACSAKQTMTKPAMAQPLVHEGHELDYRRLVSELSEPSKRAKAADGLRKAALEGKDISGALPEL